MNTYEAALWLAGIFLMRLALPLIVTVFLGHAMRRLVRTRDVSIEA